MTNHADAGDLSVICPHCGAQVTRTLEHLRTHEEISCPSCGKMVVNADFEDTIKKAEDAFKDVLRQLGGLEPPDSR